MSRPGIVAVLVPNGLGHARRTVGILARYLERGGDATITVVAEEWQRQAARGWPAGRTLEARGTRWRPGIVEPGVHWTNDVSAYDDGRLLAWEARLTDVPELEDADVVLSDNLVGVLAARPDAHLLGSFLWSDVLGGPDRPVTAAIGAFVEHERELLAAHRPEMLCVESLVTPGVRLRTRSVEVGWMCQDHPASPAHPGESGGHEVAVLGGWTGAADDLLVEVVHALRGDQYVVTAAAPIAARAGVEVFDPTSDRWRRTAVVVCRPGAGTLTECVDWEVPVVCVDEGANSELRHNAGRVEALGLGIDAGCSTGAEGVLAAVREVLEPDRRREIRARFGQLDRRGLDQAADWLAVHCATPLAPWSSSAAGQDGEPRW